MQLPAKLKRIASPAERRSQGALVPLRVRIARRQLTVAPCPAEYPRPSTSRMVVGIGEARLVRHHRSSPPCWAPGPWAAGDY